MRILLRPLILIWRALVTWWDDWLDQLLLNLVWALCWLTIVLGPPATFALAYAGQELARGSVESVRNLVPIARRHFLDAWLWFCANVLVFFFLGSSIFFYSQLGQTWGFALSVLASLALGAWIIVQFYALPLFFMQDESSLRLSWRNAALLVSKHPITSAVVLLYILIVLLVSFASGFLFVLGGITLVSVTGSVVTRHLLSREFGFDLDSYDSEEEE